MFLGIAYFFVGLADLIHILATEGMGVFPGTAINHNLATQLWIVARYLESISILLSTIFLTRTLHVTKTALIFSGVFVIMMLSIFHWQNFPACFVPDVGLTHFKIVSEYSISAIMAAAIFMAIKNKAQFVDRWVLNNIIISYSLTISSELMFTKYISVLSLSNIMGHHLKFLSVYFIYLAIVETNLHYPYQHLALANQQLKQEICQREKSEAWRQQFEHELIKISKLDSIATLSGGIAHDFKNLLTVILGNATLIEIKNAQDQKSYSNLESIKAAALQAAELTNRLISFAKGGQAVMSRFNINKLIKDTVELALSGTNVRPTFSLGKDIIIEADHDQIRQVVNNIVINAVQAMPWGGLISVKLCLHGLDPNHENIPLPPGNYVKISFTDQGVGITEENLARIFEPFFTTKDTGHGLGLATSFTIITNHQGYLTVSSQLGVGTTFTIYLPAAELISAALDEVAATQHQ